MTQASRSRKQKIISRKLEEMPYTFIARMEFDPATRLYTGTVQGLRGTHSQGATLDELHHNLWRGDRADS